MPELTPFQTVGPYFALLPGLDSPDGAVRHPGSGPSPDGPDHIPGRPDQPGGDDVSAQPVVTVAGVVRDGAGAPVPDALLEFWHAGATRVVRAPTDAAGQFVFSARRPTATQYDGGSHHAAHFAVGVLARGVLPRLITRLYFPDEPANAADPVLSAVPATRRDTLVARLEGHDQYRFDIVLQGERETVFFDA